MRRIIQLISCMTLLACAALGQIQVINQTDSGAVSLSKINSNFAWLNANKAQVFSGTGAPGVVATSKRGDFYIRTDNNTAYQCFATTCTTVASGDWQLSGSGGGGSGCVPSGTVNQILVDSGSGTCTSAVPTIVGSILTLGTLNASTAVNITASNGPAMTVSLSPFGTGAADNGYNSIIVSPDTRKYTTGFGVGLNVVDAPAAGFRGGREAIQGLTVVNGAEDGTTTVTSGNYVGVQGIGQATTNLGGTNTGAGAFGAIFGVGAWADATAGSTNLLAVTGIEVNYSMAAGATAKLKEGIAIVQHPNDLANAASLNAALSISSASSLGVTHGIAFNEYHAFAPIKTTGTLIGTIGTATIAQALDVSSYDLTSWLLNSKKVRVAGQQDGYAAFEYNSATGPLTTTGPGFGISGNKSAGNAEVNLYNTLVGATATLVLSQATGVNTYTDMAAFAPNFVEFVGISGAMTHIVRSTGAATAAIAIDTTASTQISTLNLRDQSTVKWQVQKLGDNSFRLYDFANSLAAMTITTGGNVTIGETGHTVALPITGSTQCLHVSTAGVVSGTGSDCGAGGGDVVGPASATDNAVTRFNSTTGKLVKNSGVIIDDSNNIDTPGNIHATGKIGTGTDPGCTAGTAGNICLGEGTAPTGVADAVVLYADTDASTLKVKLNGNSADTVCTLSVGCGGGSGGFSGTKALATSAISSETCSSAQTVSATGVVSTDTLQWSFNGDQTATTGYAPLTAGGLWVMAYPTADTINFKVCNPTGSSITPGAVTLNWAVGARIVASGVKALATGAITSEMCTAAQTFTATGALTTDIVSWSFNSDPTAVTGYAPLTAGGLVIYAYPTSDTVNFKVCNPTSGSITPGALTLNLSLSR